jgi:hypothetical protein
MHFLKRRRAASPWNDDQLFCVDGSLQRQLVTSKEIYAPHLFPQNPSQKSSTTHVYNVSVQSGQNETEKGVSWTL